MVLFRSVVSVVLLFEIISYKNEKKEKELFYYAPYKQT